MGNKKENRVISAIHMVAKASGFRVANYIVLEELKEEEKVEQNGGNYTRKASKPVFTSNWKNLRKR